MLAAVAAVAVATAVAAARQAAHTLIDCAPHRERVFVQIEFELKLVFGACVRGAAVQMYSIHHAAE